MKRPSLALLILCFTCALAHGQSMMRANRPSAEPVMEGTADQVLATRAILLLKRLDDEVIVYRSRDEFEEGRQLARVSLEDFETHLREASVEVRTITPSLSDSTLRRELTNALASFRDGAFWWEGIDQPRVIYASLLTPEPTRSPSDSFLLANSAYTVAVYWRQAHKYFERAVKQAASQSD